MLWKGEELDETTRGRVAGLFRLSFLDAPGDDPVYLILAFSPDKVMRMKPQNLLTGLPANRQLAFA